MAAAERMARTYERILEAHMEKGHFVEVEQGNRAALALVAERRNWRLFVWPDVGNVIVAPPDPAMASDLCRAQLRKKIAGKAALQVRRDKVKKAAKVYAASSTCQTIRWCSLAD